MVFVVLQVNGEGYVLTDEFVDAVKNLYPEKSLETLVEESAKNCSKEANPRAKRRYKSPQI
jgi:alkyl hydroperoxide reductase subunit AhpF